MCPSLPWVDGTGSPRKCNVSDPVSADRTTRLRTGLPWLFPFAFAISFSRNANAFLGRWSGFGGLSGASRTAVTSTSLLGMATLRASMTSCAAPQAARTTRERTSTPLNVAASLLASFMDGCVRVSSLDSWFLKSQPCCPKASTRSPPLAEAATGGPGVNCSRRGTPELANVRRVRKYAERWGIPPLYGSDLHVNCARVLTARSTVSVGCSMPEGANPIPSGIAAPARRRNGSLRQPHAE